MKLTYSEYRELPGQGANLSPKSGRAHSSHPPYLILVDVGQPVVGEHVAQPVRPSPGLVDVRILPGEPGVS